MKTSRYRLKEILKIKNGRDHSKLEIGSYPVIGSGGVMRYVNKYLYKGESVLLPRKGTLNNIQYINNAFWTVDTCYYTEINKDIAYPYYLYRLLRSLDLSGLDSGASIPSMTSKCYYGIKIDLPELSTQKRIADMLYSYDELIENNNRRIALLEKAAQELYKEWFVRFRFPGHENTKFENGLPEGWERKKVSTYYNTCSGGTPSRTHEEYFDTGIYPWVKTGEIKDCIIIDTEEYITEEAVKKSSAKLLPAKLVAMAMYGVNIGQLGYFDSQMTCNQACCVFSDKRNFSSKHYLFQYLKSIREYLLLISFGAAQQNLSQDLIKKIKIVMPSEEVVRAFEERIDVIYDSIKMLMQKNKNLAKQRDLLLPRLMSGKLEV